MECPNCNTNNHGNRKACSNCGAALRKRVVQERIANRRASVTQVKATQETDWLESILETIANSPRIKWMIAAGVVVLILVLVINSSDGSQSSSAKEQNEAYRKMSTEKEKAASARERTDADNIRSFQNIHGVTAIPPVPTVAVIRQLSPAEIENRNRQRGDWQKEYEEMQQRNREIELNERIACLEYKAGDGVVRPRNCPR